MSGPLLRCAGLRFGYAGGPEVLSGVDFEVGPGERIGLTGANGSGKSTLLHLVMGLIAPSAGRIELFGAVRRTEADFAAVRGRAGLLFQDSDDQLFCPTVGEDVAFGPLNQGKPPREARGLAEAALARVGLEGFENRVTYKLSGGEKRLAALAGVLAMEPELLLLDEPVAGLDEASGARVAEVLAALPQEMVAVSHNASFLDQVCTRRLRIEGGRTVSAAG